jgi:hypothetical protein
LQTDVCAILQESLADAMHAIHDPAVTGKNDGEIEIAVEHQACMVNDVTAGDGLGAFVGPIGLVQLANRAEWDALPGKIARQQDKTANVPRTKPLRQSAEVILRSHGAS